MAIAEAVGSAIGTSAVTAQGSTRPQGTVTTQRAAFVQEEFRSVVWQSTPIKDAYGKVARDTKDQPIPTFFDNMDDCYTIAQERGRIIGSHARRFRVVVDRIITEAELGFATTLPGARLIDTELVADMDVAIAALESVDFNSEQTVLQVWGRIGPIDEVSGEVIGPSSDPRVRASIGSAAGSSSGTGIGSFVVDASAATGTASGVGTASAVGVGAQPAVGTAAGVGTATAVGDTVGGTVITSAAGAASGSAGGVAPGVDALNTGPIYYNFDSNTVPAALSNATAAGWFIFDITDPPHTKALRSNNIAENQATAFTFTAAITGTLSLRYKVSSEAGWDFFRVSKNGTQQFQDSGNAGGYEAASFEVAQGDTIEFRYFKDGGGDDGTDDVYVSEIRIEGPATVSAAAGAASGAAGGIAAGTTVGSAPAFDPYYSNVVYLNGYENPTPYTSEQPVRASTTSGGGFAAVSTGPFGGLCLNCQIGYRGYPDSSDFHFGSAPFTVETWVMFSSGNQNVTLCHLLGQHDVGANQRSFALSHGAGNILAYVSATGAESVIVASAASGITSSGVWYHVALDFDGTAYRTYVNGAMKGKTVAAHALHNSTAAFTVGGILNNGNLNTNFNGWLDETRITKGVARYASDAGFAAPTANFPRVGPTI